MYNNSDRFKLFCLEGVKEISDLNASFILPFLENLALHQGIVNTYKSCDSIESLEESLSTLLYADRSFKDYEILYLVFEGEGNAIVLDDYYYILGEIAEFFEGKLSGKILHFANTKLLDLDEEEAQYFLDVTGARAVSGYNKKVPVYSAAIDNEFFGLCQQYDDVVEIVEELYANHAAICTTMGFVLYY